MWLTASAVYWSSLGLLAYTYAGYPVGITLLSRFRRRRVRAAPIEPTLSILLVSRNEQARIATKLDNLLALDYPADKRQVVVVSDASDDQTDAIVAGYRDRGVVLVRMEQPSGKAACINRGMQRAKGEIVVLCDTRQRVDEGALRAMVALFADPQVGAVSGELVLGGERGPGLYWAYEKLIRMAESRFDSTVGASGAFYAIRRHLFRELPDGCLLDDVFIPMNIVCQGFRVVIEPEAKFYDEEAPISGEFARKARTLAGNFQLLHQLPEVLNPLKNRIFPQFVSHKLARLACPVALGGLLLSNGALVLSGAPGWPFYVATLGGQLGFYALAARGWRRGEGAGRLARLSHTFVVLNAAAVAGLTRYLKGDFTWTSYRSS